MRRVRRSDFVYVRVADSRYLDVAALARGHVTVEHESHLVAFSLLSSLTTKLGAPQLDALLETPREWSETRSELQDALAARGVLVSDDPSLAPYRARDELLTAGGWDPASALFHWETQRGGDADRVALPEDPAAEEAAAREYYARFGPPPPEFDDRRDSSTAVRLPATARGDGLYGVLRARRTTRAFSPDSLATDQLATILLYVFGVHGTATIREGFRVLRRTSPSGGALHPIDVYPLVLNVDGVEPGLYRYQPRDHTLRLVRAGGEQDLAERAVAGQTHFAGAAALFLLVARFERMFWKYRRYARAYAVLMMDAGHLSQTLYLVATELGLGAFVTAAIDAQAVEDALGLDGMREGAIAVCGCGIPRGDPSPLELDFEPYAPR